MPHTKPVLILLLGFLLAGCVSDPEGKGDKMIFRYNESSGITSLDPAFSRMQTNIWACNHLYDGLVRLNRRLEVVPALAVSWIISPDGLTYTFILRQDVFFHPSPAFGSDEPRRLVAEDAVYSFNRLRNPELASPGAWVLNGLDSIYSRGEDTLVIRLKQAFSPFLGMLAMGYCSIVPREAVEFYGSDFGRNPVGTGPFYFQVWRENEKLVLRRNPHYFMKDSAGNRLPYLDGVAIRFIPDKQAGFLEFLQHKLDFVSGLDASYKDEVLTPAGKLKKEYSHLVLNRNEYLNAEYLGVLTDPDKSAFVGPAPLRRALNMAIDRRAMMRFLRNNIGLPAVKGFVPPSLMPDTALPALEFNPRRALELVDSLRAAGALKPLVIETNPAYLDLCEYVQRQWQQVGIDARVEVSPPSTLRQAMATSRVGIFRASWIADYPDAENYFSLFYSALAAPNGPNYTRFQHPEFDRLYEELRACTDTARRKLVLVKMAEIIKSEAPVVPLFYDEALRFYRPEWEGLEGNALNLLDLRRVRRK